MAAEACYYCGEPLGYGLFYLLCDVHRLAHAACKETHDQRKKMLNLA